MTPVLARHARLRWNQARGQWTLLLPETVVLLNDTAGEVLSLCDGTRDLDAVVSALAENYDGVDAGEVAALLDGLGGAVVWT
ncbi:MAG: pyrroloquinoline quinone biosynthesis peptide chaperone PqqD [Mycobacteriales bacterium]